MKKAVLKRFLFSLGGILLLTLLPYAVFCQIRAHQGMWGYQTVPAVVLTLYWAGCVIWSVKCNSFSPQLLLTFYPAIAMAAAEINFPPAYKYAVSREYCFAIVEMAAFFGADLMLRNGFSGWRRSRTTLLTLLTGGLFLTPAVLLFRNVIDRSAVSFESLKAIYQTDFAEAADFLTGQSYGLWGLLAGTVFLAALWFWNYRFPARCHRSFCGCGFALLLAPALWGCSLWFPAHRTRCGELLCRSFEYFREVRDYAGRRQERLQAADRRLLSPGRDGVYLLILGESHNRRYFSCYGHDKPTTPNLEKFRRDQDFLFFERAYSCHCQTVPTLSYLLTDRNQYRAPQLPAITLPDAAKARNYTSVWISNQYPWGEFDTPVAAIAGNSDHVVWLNDSRDFLFRRSRRDKALLEPLKKFLTLKRGIIVLHTMGSHRHYPNRYPEHYAENLGLSEYERSIRYSDEFLGELFALLKQTPQVKAACFISDHSHIPADHRGHNADQYDQEMTEIPMFLYLSPEFRRDAPELTALLKEHRTRVFTNDLVFELMLSLNGTAPRSRWNVGDPGYVLTEENAMTLWNTRKLVFPAVTD